MDKNVMNDESLWVVHYGHNQYDPDKYGHDNCVL